VISWNKVKSCDNNDKSHYIIWNNSEIKQDIGKNGMIKELNIYIICMILE